MRLLMRGIIAAVPQRYKVARFAKRPSSAPASPRPDPGPTVTRPHRYPVPPLPGTTVLPRSWSCGWTKSVTKPRKGNHNSKIAEGTGEAGVGSRAAQGSLGGMSAPAGQIRRKSHQPQIAPGLAGNAASGSAPSATAFSADTMSCAVVLGPAQVALQRLVGVVVRGDRAGRQVVQLDPAAAAGGTCAAAANA